jgi:hypothetical protein
MIIEDVVGHIPFEAGRVVGICSNEGRVFLACEHRVYRLSPDFYAGDMHVETIARVPPMPDPI